MAGYGRFEHVMDAMEGAVTASDYVAGDRFTAADVYFGSQIGWGLMFGSIEKRPAFEEYWARIRDRPAAKRARELDDALLAQQQAATQA
jgi:glutathione S-transferase